MSAIWLRFLCVRSDPQPTGYITHCLQSRRLQSRAKQVNMVTYAVLPCRAAKEFSQPLGIGDGAKSFQKIIV